ncbi:MAG: PaaI family thioesterase [Deltaproteobacteria bacterium]|nr:PaaI family thioesterase [Deltaproteobacteria bacterium]
MAASPWTEELERKMARTTGPGVTTLEQVKAVSGLEYLRRIIDGRLPRPPIADTLSCYLVEADPGRAVFQGTPRWEYLNPAGTVHGGWMATLLDAAMACAVQTALQAGQGYTTVEFKLNLVRPVLPATGAVRAEGKVVNVGRTIATAEGRLLGEDGKLYAHGTETCLVISL